MRGYVVGFAAAYLSLAFANPPTAQPTFAILDRSASVADVDASASLAVLDRSASVAVVD